MNIRPLKQVVMKLPVNSPLRNVVLSQPDEVPNDEFVAKIEIILQLARME